MAFCNQTAGNDQWVLTFLQRRSPLMITSSHKAKTQKAVEYCAHSPPTFFSVNGVSALLGSSEGSATQPHPVCACTVRHEVDYRAHRGEFD
jgi:hypothetical protein